MTEGDGEEGYRRLFHEAHDAVLVVSRDGRIVDANPAAARMYGLPQESMVGSSADDLWIDGSDRQAFRDAVEARGQVRGYRARHRHADGSTLQVRITAVVWEGPDGGVEGYQGMVQDVTREVRARQKLEAAEARYRTLVEAAPVGIVVHRDGRIRYMNPRAAELVGARDPGEMVDDPVLEYVHPRDREAAEEMFRRVQEERRPAGSLRIRGLRADGTVFDVELTSRPVEFGDEPAVQSLARDITREVRLRERLEQMAYYDSLTGLANRRLLREKGEQALREARRYGRGMALLCLDLQRFKAVNDSFGHQAGDQVLVEASRRLVRTLRSADVVARVGSDEFAALLTEVSDREGAHRAARRVLDAFRGPFRVESHSVRIGCSLGVAHHPDPNPDGDFDAVMAQADMALYEASRRRGHAYQVYEPSMEVFSSDRLTLEEELHRSLESDALELHFQPIREAEAGGVQGFEALARWPRPGQGQVGPGTFVALAEDTGMIRRLDRWALRAAVREASSWTGPSRRRWVAVNLSSDSLQDPELSDVVSETLDRQGLAPERLVVEVSESAAMQNVDAAASLLADLRRAGVRVALDDFGTGHSALGYLKQLPVDLLKIDMIFVHGAARDSRDEELIRAVLTLGHGLGLEVVAEGVEREEQRDWLRDAGCDLMQGFLLGRPVPPEETVHTNGHGAEA